MTENTFADCIRSYVDSKVDIPSYVNDVILNHNLNPIKI